LDADIVHDHLGSLPGGFHCDGLADAAAGTGYDDDFSVQYVHQIFGAETVAFRPWRKRRSLSWVLVEVTIEACRVSQLCGGNVEKSIERIAVHLLPVDATAGWFRLVLCVG
jgi:hypothetical protein